MRRSSAALRTRLAGGDRAMLERMVFYGQTGRCRWKVLLDNFGAAEGFDSCGSCDNCVRIAAAFAAAEGERERKADDQNEAAPAPLPARGEIVSVPRCGRGIVDAVDAEGIAVVFAEGSRRVFMPAFVRRRPSARKRGPSTRSEFWSWSTIVLC